MRKTMFAIGFISLLLLLSVQLPAFDSNKTKQANAESTSPTKVKYKGEREMDFNEDWRFKKETDDSLDHAKNPDFDDASWRQLALPHDWSIESDFNPDSPATHEGGYLDGGTGWYRKTFTVPESMEGKQISIDFDGVYMNSTTYLNGKKLGTYPYGYNAFSYDLTDDLYTDGRENVLAVKVDNTQPSSRWYSGSGIYRNVHLTVADSVHVAKNGTFVTTPDLESAYEDGKADVHIKTEVDNTSNEETPIEVKSTIQDEDGQTVAEAESKEKLAAGKETVAFEDDTTIDNPELWGLDNPYRYNLVTEVMVDGQVVDTYETKFGVRYVDFDADDGFSLNGEEMKLHGTSMHHDGGALGAEVNSRAVERQMQILKGMGVNAIRSTHNPASPELLEAANKEGLLVIDEAFDAWDQSKKEFDYARFFSEHADRFDSTWAEHDIKEMVDRGKNEPSVIMWSLGNEIPDTATAEGVEIAKNLNKWVKEMDTTRPTTIGENKDENPLNEHVEEVLDTVDVVGLNYAEGNYEGYHEKHPEWKIYGSETSSATRSRGVYTHPYEYNALTTYDDLQQSSYDNDYVSWGTTAENAWQQDRDKTYIGGQFIWTGFDYIGEPTPYYESYPSKSSYFGAVDTAGFPKDIYYYYQSQWTDEPMVHLLPHWNWEDGEDIRVLAYSNADKVELFLNGTSIGERNYETKEVSGKAYKETSDGDTYLEWKVPFESGTLEAVAKDENDEVIARDKVETAGEPAKINLTADRDKIDADGTDLSYVTADVVDKDGNIVPEADNQINFATSGNGKLAGVDNGNAASVERYKDDKRKAFKGKALGILQADKAAGEITLSVSADGLKGDSITIETTPVASDGDDVSIASMKELVNQYEAGGAIDGQQVAHKLNMQLTAIGHFAKNDSTEKAIKHMKNFKQLVEQYQEKDSIDKSAANELKQQADDLLKEWKA